MSQNAAQGTKQTLFTPILIGGCIVLLTGFAIRASFGIFQIPIAEQFGWLRSEFSMAIAIQNLAWGIGQPIFAALAEKFGDKRAIMLGALCYAIGLVWSSYAVTPGAHHMLEVLVGFGIAGTGFGVILSIVGRSASDEHRSLALGITTAAGSAGQVVGPPIAEALLQSMNWSQVFVIFALAIIVAMLVLPMLGPGRAATRQELEDTFGQVLSKAMKDPSYTMIFLGFFSCGFQLAFVTAHFPAFVTEACAAVPDGGILSGMGIDSTSALGALAIAIIGLANIVGSITAGALGRYYSKKYLLAAIYLGRTIAAAAFIMLPMTPTTVIIFSIVMGSLWLATVPLTSGLIAHIYGLRYMGTLYGVVFFSHQLGSFLGVWLGGWMYDLYGSYDVVWWVGVGVGAFSAVIHLPVKENRVAVRAA